MKMRINRFVSLIFFLPGITIHAQEKTAIKFGDVTEKDLAVKAYNIDNNASAVILADIGSSKIEGNNKGWFSLVYKHYKKMHILNKNGYDIAGVSIFLYSDGRDEEQLDKLKAVTYNLENGKVIQTKLDIKTDIFKDKIDKNRVIKKFTFPNIKEGSIIEYEYTVISDFLFNLQSWEFQGSYPRLWSEYNLTLPVFLSYLSIPQGYKNFDISDRKDRREIFLVSDPKSQVREDAVNIEADVSDYRWIIKNVPALKEESYTYTLDNHIAKIDFQLAEQLEPLQPQKFIGTWEQFSKKLMDSKEFGLPLSEDNYWFKDIIDPLIKDASSVAEKAGRIFAYVRNNFTCTNYDRKYMDQNLHSLVKNRSGNVAEINLLLTAMLKYAGINADPVILSTRSNGYTSSKYPIISQYNYVISRANINGKFHYLDASEPRLGFGHLPLRCYNNEARVINGRADLIEFKSGSVTETKYTTVFIFNNDKGKLSGTMQQSPGYYESLRLRNVLQEKGQDMLQRDIIKAVSPGIEISNFHIDSLDKYESGLAIKYDFDIKDESEDIIYLNPFFGGGFRDNPFKSTQRLYPVEMPYAMDETYNLQAEVPHGYAVDELPKTMTVKLNEQGEGIFEYQLSQSDNNISFHSRIRLTRTYFTPDEYNILREFFSLVVKKQAEQIVFKKKK